VRATTLAAWAPGHHFGQPVDSHDSDRPGLADRATGRVRFEFLPLHASWLNQIEIWFSILERQALKRASDTHYDERARRIYAFARHWNRTAHPFRWTFKGYPLQR
jgi:transposase